MKLINLTPHIINILNDDGAEIASVEPSGTVARCTVSRELVESAHGIDFYTSVYGDVYDLPEAADGTRYIVSGLVRAALPERTDLWQPGELVRDESGRPIGCHGLSR